MENRIINKWKRFFSGHIFGKAENNMSKIISLFMERKISKDEIFSLLQLMGGKVHINAPDQVVLEDIEGAVWCYYRGENFNLDDREQLKLKRYSIKCNTELALELGSDENSSRLAEKIKILVDEFGMCIIYSDFVPCSKRILAEMSNALFDLREISGETVFIDGTKIEAAANKYTFVWKKAVTKNQTKLLIKLADFVAECEQLYDLKIVYGDTVKMKHVKKLRKKLYALKQAENVVFVHGIGKRKTPLQKSIETLEDYLSRLKKYNHQIHICGGRNSYSKTDHDATFMRMKEDAMGNGQLKPAYNLQHGVDSEYITWLTTGPQPTDTTTLVPFLKDAEEHLKFKYKNITADAGYESEENYVFLEENGKLSCIKPANYEISKTRRYRNDIGRMENMEYDAESDAYICRNAKRLVPDHVRHSKSKTGYISEKTIYKLQITKELLNELSQNIIIETPSKDSD